MSEVASESVSEDVRSRAGERVVGQSVSSGLSEEEDHQLQDNTNCWILKLPEVPPRVWGPDLHTTKRVWTLQPGQLASFPQAPNRYLPSPFSGTPTFSSLPPSPSLPYRLPLPSPLYTTLATSLRNSRTRPLPRGSHCSTLMTWHPPTSTSRRTWMASLTRFSTSRG